ncbi:MAG: NAD(P)-binding domain-containing protein [Christensenellaceae bacterium]|nr:NAD(P)-binding domain-containing protein [Christensenellaceae bacterium]
MKIGIIGYGSMGKMILEKIARAQELSEIELFVSNRTKEKIAHLKGTYNVCEGNAELASLADIIFICVEPTEMREVFSEIRQAISEDTLLISLNGSITFEQLESVCRNKIAKVIPAVTAEVNKSQTLVCFNEAVSETDKAYLAKLLRCMGDVIELPENEIDIGADLVSCMPGFIAAIFNEFFASAKKRTRISNKEIIQMLLKTMVGTGELMLADDYSFEDVVLRVATKGGITEEGVKVIREHLPKITDKLFDKTLEKCRITTMNAQKMFDEEMLSY